MYYYIYIYIYYYIYIYITIYIFIGGNLCYKYIEFYHQCSYTYRKKLKTSLLKILKRSGPSIEPCSIPLEISIYALNFLLTLTFHILLFK